MARADISIYSTGGLSDVPSEEWQTEAAAGDILAGEPVKLKSAGSPYVIRLVDADLTPGTDTLFIGIAANDATHTAAADGKVKVYMWNPTITYEAKAKTAASVDTQSEIDALCGDRKIFDLTGTTFTVDDGAADSANNCLLIVGGDPNKKTLRFRIRPWANVVDGA